MSSFLSDPTSLNIFNESDLSNIIYNCGYENIMDIIENNIDYRFTSNVSEISNLVGAIENVFKINITNLGEGNPAIKPLREVREQCYQNIIEIICNKFNISFDAEAYKGNDLYTAAFVLYRFLISNFRNNISDFYTNYIIKERNSIYDILEIARFKKQKDSTTLYNKKTYNNQKLGLIAANLSFVIENMQAFDLPFKSIVENIFCFDKPSANFILTYFSSNGDFYKESFLPVFNSELRSTLIIDITYKINKIAICMDTNIITDNEN